MINNNIFEHRKLGRKGPFQLKTAVILGTRPEIIKMSPIIKELGKQGIDYFILHTGQHYSFNMDRIFFKQLQIPEAKYNLEVGSGTHAEQTAKILTRTEQVLFSEKPDIVLIEGDTNTVLAGALAASKLHLKIGHVEAGLRSYDRQMPEEINRIFADHCSDFLFAPTEKAKNNLLREGILKNKIAVTGNSIVDAIYQNIDLVKHSGDILKVLNIHSKEYFLVTIHRQENVDDRERFLSILRGLELLIAKFQFPIVFPIHPRSRKMIQEYKISINNLTLIDPVDFFAFLQLEKNAKLVLTDSGGVQEESCILKTPCVTLRDNTERPETVEVGANILAGAVASNILSCSEIMLNLDNTWNNPFGDGKTGERIVTIIHDALVTLKAENIDGE